MMFAASVFFLMSLQRDIINVRVNGTLVNPGKVVHNRTMVPTRGVLEKLGVTVLWVPATRSVIASNDTTSITLKIGRSTAIVNGRELPLETPPFVDAGTTYVPLRFIAESMHALVGYDSATNTATVDDDKQVPAPTPPTPNPVPPAAPRPLGDLQSTAQDWVVGDVPVRFSIAGPDGGNLSLAFDPAVSAPISMVQDSNGTYAAEWVPPAAWNRGDSSVTVTLLRDGQPTDRTLRLRYDDPQVGQTWSTSQGAVLGEPLWLHMKRESGPGFDPNQVTVIVNGRDLGDRVQVSDFDVKVDLPLGRNEVHIAARDRAGKRIQFDTTADVIAAADAYITFETPTQLGGGDTRFRIIGPPNSRFSVRLASGLRISADQMREVSAGRYEGSLIGADPALLEAGRAEMVNESVASQPPLLTGDSYLRWDQVRMQTVDNGTLIQVNTTPGCRLVYYGPDGAARDFAEQPDRPGTYLVVVPSPSNIDSPVRPYIRILFKNRREHRDGDDLYWPGDGPKVARLEPDDGARVDRIPNVIKVSIDSSTSPGLDPGSVQMWLDRNPVSDISLVSGIEVSFRPGRNLSPGDHTVELRARDRLGRPMRTRWTFTYRSRPAGDPPRILQFEFLGRGDIVGGQTTRANFKVSGIPSDARMTVTSSAPGVAGVPQTVLVSDGGFTITSRRVDKSTHADITLSFGATSAVLPLTLMPEAVSYQLVDLIALTARDHDSPNRIRVRINRVATEGGLVINFATQTPRLVVVPSSVRLRPGSIAEYFNITVSGVDGPQTASVTATLQGSPSKTLQFPVAPARLGPVASPSTVKPSAKFNVIFNLRSPMGPAGGSLKLTGDVAKDMRPVRIPPQATSVSVPLTATATEGLMRIMAELNGTRATVVVKVSAS